MTTDGDSLLARRGVPAEQPSDLIVRFTFDMNPLLPGCVVRVVLSVGAGLTDLMTGAGDFIEAVASSDAPPWQTGHSLGRASAPTKIVGRAAGFAACAVGGSNGAPS